MALRHMRIWKVDATARGFQKLNDHSLLKMRLCTHCKKPKEKSIKCNFLRGSGLSLKTSQPLVLEDWISQIYLGRRLSFPSSLKKASITATAFSMGVSGCIDLAGPKIYPPSSPIIRQSFFTSVLISSGVPKGMVR